CGGASFGRPVGKSWIPWNPFGRPPGGRRDSLLLGVGEVEWSIRRNPGEYAQHLFVASCRDDASRAQDFGDLYRQLPRDSGGAENQDSFASGQLRTVLERQPGRHTGIGNGRGSDIV